MTTPPVRKNFLWFILAVNLMALPALIYFTNQKITIHAAGAPNAAGLLPGYGQVAAFSLLDQNKNNVSLEDLRGKVWIADFIFTNCPNQCPMMSQKMGLLQQALPSGAQLVSISVDPERDTPDMLLNYAKTFNAKENKWFFLTGDKERVNSVLKSFHVNNADDPNLHSLRFALVDQKGEIRGYYDSMDPEATKKLAADTNLLLRTNKNGQ